MVGRPDPATVIVDNLGAGQSSSQVSFAGIWSPALRPGAFGANASLINIGTRPASYVWKTGAFSPDRSCTYQVSVWWTSGLIRSSRVPYTVSGQTGGAATRTFDQHTAGGQWNAHGTYTFAAGRAGVVTVTRNRSSIEASACQLFTSGSIVRANSSMFLRASLCGIPPKWTCGKKPCGL